MSSQVRWPRWIFIAAGLYGLAIIIPQYVMEARIGRDFPPAITHPEHFCAFLGVALAWQLAFASDVKRYRLLMLPAVVEKLAFGVPAIVLHLQGRAPALVAGFGAFDLLLAAGFALAHCVTPAAQ